MKSWIYGLMAQRIPWLYAQMDVKEETTIKVPWYLGKIFRDRFDIDLKIRPLECQIHEVSHLGIKDQFLPINIRYVYINTCKDTRANKCWIDIPISIEPKF